MEQSGTLYMYTLLFTLLCTLYIQFLSPTFKSISDVRLGVEFLDIACPASCLPIYLTSPKAENYIIGLW